MVITPCGQYLELNLAWLIRHRLMAAASLVYTVYTLLAEVLP